MIQTINVNLRPCNCDSPPHKPGGIQHLYGCASAPFLIPCPIPRSVTFFVALGECDCPPPLGHGAYGHSPNCPARPVRVSCSISGNTWEESHPVEFEMEPSGISPNDTLRDACRARWALVKALVLGEDSGPWMLSEAWAEKWDIVAPLFAQRDAVFSVLTDMARAEEAQKAASARVTTAIYGAPRAIRLFSEPEYQELLGRYVGRLIEQVEVM